MNTVTTGGKKQVCFHLSIIFVAISVAYFKVLHAPFSTWDDDDYVFQNPDIQAIDFSHIYKWFTGYYVGNYSPLTMFTYALEYAAAKLDPFIYHLSNIVIHLFNTIALYFLIKRIQTNALVALFTALLFSLAPVQNEGVSWISERKTLLCTLFYLLALLQYTSYIARPLFRKLLLVFLLAIAAMLSKAIAVALPLSMFAVDIWMHRDFRSRKIWLEKIPLFAIAIIIGLTAIKAEAAGHFLGLHPESNPFASLIIAAFTYVQYAAHIIAPVHLTLYYPYPEHIGPMQYLCLLLVIGIARLFFVSWRRKWYVLCGGILFYTVNIALVLQFVQFSLFLMVDHYSYIASIGFIFPLVYYIVNWLSQKGRPMIAAAIFACLSITFLVTTFIRNDIWLSDVNFVSSLVEDFPESAVAQYTAGAFYMKDGNYKESEIRFNKAVALDPRNYRAWYNKGALALREGKVAESLDALNKCLAIAPYPMAYFSRALLYMGTGKPDLALADAASTLSYQPGNARAWYIKGYCLEQKGSMQAAIDCYTKAIEYENTEPLFYMRRGEMFVKTNQYQAAQADLKKANESDPANGETIYYLGIVKYSFGQNPCGDFQLAIKKGYKVPAEVMEKLCKTPN